MTGQQLALAGMLAADGAASLPWRDRWDTAIEELAATGRPFISDDIRAIAGPPDDHPNAAGARLQAAARRGLIRAVGFRKSERPALHAHHVREWVGR